ncbi:hypothetical protein RUM43_006944 [Polyplax serrata]|uniref:Uncharacterized protein n=1 Tax=Polyplax serrata TaxID=468196 RepID=A0AAN8PWD7_POLSC
MRPPRYMENYEISLGRGEAADVQTLRHFVSDQREELIYVLHYNLDVQKDDSFCEEKADEKLAHFTWAPPA